MNKYEFNIVESLAILKLIFNLKAINFIDLLFKQT